MDDVIGIILAAGDATRMANKLLLATREGEPVIYSSINYLTRAGVTDIRIVVPPVSSICDVVQYHSNFKNIRFFVQDTTKAYGYVQAIRAGVLATDDPNQKIVVLCGDNLFSSKEKIKLDEQPGFAQTRPFPAEIAKHLTRYAALSQEELRTRPRHACYHWTRGAWKTTAGRVWCFAGVLAVQVKQLHRLNNTPDMTTERMLNCLQIRPDFIHEPNRWYDIGTPETYERYWNAKCDL